MNKRCLVLGANGFIGSHLVDALIDRGYRVTAFDKFSRPPQFNRSSKIRIIKAEFGDSRKIKIALKDVDFVLHYLWSTNPGSSMKTGVGYEVETNILPSLFLLDSAVKQGVKKIIFSSSSTVYGSISSVPISEGHYLNPQTPHALAKVAMENFLAYYDNLSDMECIIFRIGNAYGPRQNPFGGLGFIAAILGNLSKGEKPIIFGDGSVIRDYIFIDDIVRANLAAIGKKTNQRIMNVGFGKGHSLNDIISKISKSLGREVEVDHQAGREADIPKVVLNINRVKNELRFKPKTDINEGIKKTWRWVKHNYESG